MNNQTICKIKDFYKSPIKIFGIIVVILSLALLFSCNFHYPDYYTNRELADNIAQTVAPKEVNEAVKHLLNPQYKFYNILFQIWGYFVAAFSFTLIFRIKEFKDFKAINVFNKKLFVYLWINISYLIWGILRSTAYITDLGQYVYNGNADSLGLPLFELVCIIAVIIALYAPTVNILSFITFNTKIKRTFYNFIWGIIFYFWVVATIDSFNEKFICIQIVLDFIYLTWFTFIVYAIGYNRNKQKQA